MKMSGVLSKLKVSSWPIVVKSGFGAILMKFARFSNSKSVKWHFELAKIRV